MLGCVSSVFHRFIFTEVETVETDRVNVPKAVCFLVNQRAVRSTADFVRGIVAGSAARRKNRVRIHGFKENGEVKRNGQIEQRKRAKIRKGEIIEVLGETIQILAE